MCECFIGRFKDPTWRYYCRENLVNFALVISELKNLLSRVSHAVLIRDRPITNNFRTLKNQLLSWSKSNCDPLAHRRLLLMYKWCVENKENLVDDGLTIEARYARVACLVHIQSALLSLKITTVHARKTERER